jgi:predicted dehydrogenase
MSGAAIGSLVAVPKVHAQGSSAVNVGLIGCGGRGSQAAVNAMRADANNRLTVMCDMFPDRLEFSRKGLQTQLEQQFRVTDDTCFTGFDGY